MSSMKFSLRRLVKTVMLVIALACGGVFGLYKSRVDIPPLNTSRIYASLDTIVARVEPLKERAVRLYESYFHKDDEEEVHHEQHQIVVTSPIAKDVIIPQEYVCQIHSRRHIDVCALESGYLMAIPVREGQMVREGDLMFEVKPILYKARWEAEVAEKELARLELANTQRLATKQGVSQNEVKLFEAKLAKAQAKADLALAELNFATIRAPFDGIIDRQRQQQGSLVKEGDILTTLSDNSVMWVYFNVTEKRYLEFMAETKHDLRLMPAVSRVDDIPTEGKNLIIVAEVNHVLHFRILDGDGKKVIDTNEKQLTEQARPIADLRKQLESLWPPRELAKIDKDRMIAAVTSIVGYIQSPDVVLMLANHTRFPHIGKIGAIEANFNNQTGNIAFRADFPNPDGLLRHGQTGTVLINRLLKGAIVIPQRATFENLAKRYVYVVDKDNVVRQREIEIDYVLEDVFVIGKEVPVTDKIVLEGIRQVRDGEKVEYEFLPPDKVLANQKNHAE